MNNNKIKLHLGCGEKYLPGYINIDLPPDQHNQMKVRADIYQDIRTLDYSKDSVDEIRSHHLLEHFTRQEALGLLVKWRCWLKPRGILVIETPDFDRAIFRYLLLPLKYKFKLGRHIFGSQETSWALHKDFWSKKKLTFVLEKFGFKNFAFEHTNTHKKLLPNILVRCEKGNQEVDTPKIIKEILQQSLVGDEKEILDLWLRDIKSP